MHAVRCVFIHVDETEGAIYSYMHALLCTLIQDTSISHLKAPWGTLGRQHQGISVGFVQAILIDC